jgi:ribosomal protein S18 acetylase RimI-like enzyme
MALETRILDSSDQAVLANVAPGVFDNAVDPRLAREFLGDPRHHLAVAIDQGQLIGFASGVHYVHPDKPSELWINEVGVAPSHHGRGVGKAVLRALLEQGERLGCGQAWVLIEDGNTTAMRLYASVGGKVEPVPSVMFTFTLAPISFSTEAAP